MTVEVSEAFLSGDGSDSINGFDRDLIYFTFYESDEGVAAAAAIAASPDTYEGVPRVGATRKRITETVYQITVHYKLDSQQTQVSDPTTSSFNTTRVFNLVGGTEHITNARSTTSYCKTGATVVDVKKTVGVDLKTGQVRGVDVFAPVLDYSLTTMFADSVVDTAYIDTLFDLTGTVNDDTFYNRPAGSVLFKGARGSKRGGELWEISFEFAYQKNRSAVPIDGITVPSSTIPKKGWQYLEIMYEEGTTTIGGKRIQVPSQVNVHDVYEDGDFSTMKIGTS